MTLDPPHRRSLRGLAGVIAVAVALAACGGSGPAERHGDAAAIDVDLAAELSDEEVADLAESVNAFGFDLHRQLAGAEPNGNVVTSPLSVATLLAIVAAGAEGQTAEEMVEVLGLRQARDGRYAALLRRVSDTNQVELSIGNSLWLDDERELVDGYAQFVRNTFGATIDTVPLGDQSTVDVIDDWVVERTSGRIEGIAEDLGLPSDAAVLVLANAVYFLGQWTTQFDPDDTRDAAFTLPDGKTVQVPMMHSPDGDFSVGLGTGDGFAVLRLPYGEDGRYAMDVLLPAPDSDLPTLLNRLTPASLTAATDELHSTSDVPVRLPRFELQWDADLTEALRELGIRTAFSGGFSEMSPSDPFLGTVVHKTFIRVDEAGTEAAAVTGGMMPTSGMEPIAVDRPFAFTITDTTTGTVLFLGSVTDPRG